MTGGETHCLERELPVVLAGAARDVVAGDLEGRLVAAAAPGDSAALRVAADLLGLDDALSELAGSFPRQARVLECRFFGGLSVEETAAALELSPRTVKRDASFARAWLYRRVGAGGAG